MLWLSQAFENITIAETSEINGIAIKVRISMGFTSQLNLNDSEDPVNSLSSPLATYMV